MYRKSFFRLSLKDFWCHNELLWKPIWLQPCLACYDPIHYDTGVATKSSDDEKARPNLWLWPWITCDADAAALFRWPDANSRPACVSMPSRGRGRMTSDPWSCCSVKVARQRQRLTEASCGLFAKPIKSVWWNVWLEPQEQDACGKKKSRSRRDSPSKVSSCRWELTLIAVPWRRVARFPPEPPL